MGVKSLWSLLTPVGRPVMLETVEGKTMAIDSSIWIYQFQATMRDKEGRALSNAHVLGFLRRISKLLFYGIKPVFVFDGGAPALKRNTITERKKKKSGAAASHAKVAEKLLAAQMRREALNHVGSAKSTNKGKGKAIDGPVTLDEHTVYLEDLDPNMMPKSPIKKTSASSPPKKRKNYDHDPYNLPEVDLDAVISKVTRSIAPDPRLATEEELQSFIEDMRPEDFDITSPAFRELPTEVQYEIIGDLRLKSRQTSYNRLQNMLKKAPTPLDFSKQQILNLKQRNSLTQQLLTTTDSIGKAHIEIPIRIASERNREYVLVKNDSNYGGWILGIRDDGTPDKPIEIDQDDIEFADASGESDANIEEVSLVSHVQPTGDLRQRHEAPPGELASRHAAKASSPMKTRSSYSTSNVPLFVPSDEESDADMEVVGVHSEDDHDLAYAIQASLESKPTPRAPPRAASSTLLTPPKSTQASSSKESILYSNRLTTALSIAGAVPSPIPSRNPMFSSGPTRFTSTRSASPELEYVSEANLDIVVPRPTKQLTPSEGAFSQQALQSDSDADMEEVIPELSTALLLPPNFVASSGGSIAETSRGPTSATGPTFRLASSLLNPVNHTPLEPAGTKLPRSVSLTEQIDLTLSTADHGESEPHLLLPLPVAPNEGSSSLGETFRLNSTSLLAETSQANPDTQSLVAQVSVDLAPIDVGNEGPPGSWSRTPSPDHEIPQAETPARPHSPEGWDAAHEVDVRAEEDEYARFMSQVQGKDLDLVRREIDDEINSLNKAKKAAMRDSEDITQQMISQIMTMLRLFGIPYITAPMEAEAQCATLGSLGLVEGIITDDSDVFLFGGQRVFKNMFNQSKTVECFLLSDLARELGLTRDALVRLAFLLGSDYVEGLPGVGPVVAMELLREFPGEDGLHKFKDWWTKVQSGKDKPEDNQSPFRRRFKKKFKKLFLPQDWPNSAVRDAYYHPTVDESDEPFKWGLPDLDGLRMFLREELGWQEAKVDELLLPIVQRVGKRAQAAALNKQGTLSEYFDLSVGLGTYAPRKRTAYASKRLQKVVADFRKNNKGGRSSATTPEPDAQSSVESEYEDAPAKKRSKRANSKDVTDGAASKKQGRGRGRGRGRVASRSRGRGRRGGASSSRHSESPEGIQCESESSPDNASPH